jgi:hypothetical protein
MLAEEVAAATRNLRGALRRLRRCAREGAAEELALDDTIRSTAQNAGYLDIRMRPERRNTVKVLMLLDAGGSMDDHIRLTEELVSAAKSESKNMAFYHFHNCAITTYGAATGASMRNASTRGTCRTSIRRIPS